MHPKNVPIVFNITSSISEERPIGIANCTVSINKENRNPVIITNRLSFFLKQDVFKLEKIQKEQIAKC